MIRTKVNQSISTTWCHLHQVPTAPIAQMARANDSQPHDREFETHLMSLFLCGKITVSRSPFMAQFNVPSSVQLVACKKLRATRSVETVSCNQFRATGSVQPITCNQFRAPRSAQNCIQTPTLIGQKQSILIG